MFPRSSVILEDHPRLCGEKAAGHRTRQGNPGSPPPMRGKDQTDGVQTHDQGITPAYAGKRTEGSFSYETSRDHPRLCGEKFDQMCFAGRDPGSPPPMRGKVTVNPDGSVTHGITPAYAGKRPFAVNKTPAGGDHPRLCGEKFSESLQTLVMIGSPPPMRGKACDKRKFRRGIRINVINLTSSQAS